MTYVLAVEHDTPADVAELVDALVSGTSGGNIVGCLLYTSDAADE